MISLYQDIMISKNGGGIVNKTKTPTYEKIMIPLRLPPEIYSLMIKDAEERIHSPKELAEKITSIS